MADENNGLPKKFSEDGVHPNKEGYAIMAPLVESAISEALKISSIKVGDWGAYKKQKPSKEKGNFLEGFRKTRRRLPTLPHAIAVPSALSGLTSLFGMGRGGAPTPRPP